MELVSLYHWSYAEHYQKYEGVVPRVNVLPAGLWWDSETHYLMLDWALGKYEEGEEDADFG